MPKESKKNPQSVEPTVEDRVFTILSVSNTGYLMPKSVLYRKMGVIDPHEEEERKLVWRISAALASLLRKRSIVLTYYKGAAFYGAMSR